MGFFGYDNIGDALDGGGKSATGPSFEGGGFVSAVGNAFARPSGSIARGEPDMRTGLGGLLTDMWDGGGFGQSGDRFSGGPPAGALMGGLLNALNVRPMGYEDRLGAMRPQMRPNDLQTVLGALAPTTAPTTASNSAFAPTQFVDYPVRGPYPLTREGDLMLQGDLVREKLASDFALSDQINLMGGIPAPYDGYGPR